MSARHTLTILAVDDVERAAAFYEGAFGWARSVEVPVYVELALPDERRLGLYAREAFAKNVGGEMPQAVDGLTSTELYLHVDDLDEALGRLAEVGARVLSPRALRPWGDEAAYFADPDGNVVVVASQSTP